MAVTNARKDMNSDVAALYLESLTDVFAIHASRVAVGIQARIPEGIWLTLMAITILGMIGVGYQAGIAGSKRTLAMPLLAIAVVVSAVALAVLVLVRHLPNLRRLVNGQELKTDGGGDILVDKITMETAVNNAFAGGDVVGGEGTIIIGQINEIGAAVGSDHNIRLVWIRPDQTIAA